MLKPIFNIYNIFYNFFISVYLHCLARGGFSELEPQANIGMGPYTFALIYQINLEFPFLSWRLLLHNGAP